MDTPESVTSRFPKTRSFLAPDFGAKKLKKKITIVKCALLIAVAKGSIGTHVWLTRLHIMDGV